MEKENVFMTFIQFWFLEINFTKSLFLHILFLETWSYKNKMLPFFLNEYNVSNIGLPACPRLIFTKLVIKVLLSPFMYEKTEA